MMAVREKVKKNILSCTQRRDQEHLNTVNNVMCVQKKAYFELFQWEPANDKFPLSFSAYPSPSAPATSVAAALAPNAWPPC